MAPGARYARLPKSRPLRGNPCTCSGVMVKPTSVFSWSTSGATAVTSTVSLTEPGVNVKFCLLVFPMSNSMSRASAVEKLGALTFRL